MTELDSNKYSHELGLLRAIAREIDLKPHKSGPVTQDDLLRNGFARARMGPLGVIGIRPPAEQPFRDLTKLLYEADRAISRGAPYKDFESELFGTVLTRNYQKDPTTICRNDVEALVEHMRVWFQQRAGSRRVFVPCSISPWPSPNFDIGPVQFNHYELLRANPPAFSDQDDHLKDEFNSMLDTMQREGAHWLASIELTGFDENRGFEMANLAVDLAMVAIQLAAPYLDTKNISRLTSRRGIGQEQTLATYAGGGFAVGHRNREPGLSIGPDYLVKGIISGFPAIFVAVGNLVTSFASGNYRSEVLEQVWYDSAYWLHQGLAEPLDTIAVTKLETAIEVLMRAESSRGSERRVLKSLDVFFGLKPNDKIDSVSNTTAESLAKSVVAGRSRILHGTWSTLLHHASSLRSTVEYLAASLVRAYALELENYLATESGADSIDPFLDWIKATRNNQGSTSTSQP